MNHYEIGTLKKGKVTRKKVVHAENWQKAVDYYAMATNQENDKGVIWVKEL